jgi:hypothetical protein
MVLFCKLSLQFVTVFTLCSVVPLEAQTPAQLSSTAICNSSTANLPNLKSVQRGVVLQNYSGVGGTFFLPVFSARSLLLSASPDTVTTRAAIWVHGAGGSANAMFCDGVRATLVNGSEVVPSIATLQLDPTLHISPWFGNEQVNISRWWAANDSALISRSAKSVYWNSTQWNRGAAFLGVNSSSFETFDALIAILGNKTRFPNLKSITVTGFSAGTYPVITLTIEDFSLSDLHVFLKNSFPFVLLQEDSLCRGGAFSHQP